MLSPRINTTFKNSCFHTSVKGFVSSPLGNCPFLIIFSSVAVYLSEPLNTVIITACTVCLPWVGSRLVRLLINVAVWGVSLLCNDSNHCITWSASANYRVITLILGLSAVLFSIANHLYKTFSEKMQICRSLDLLRSFCALKVVVLYNSGTSELSHPHVLSLHMANVFFYKQTQWRRAHEARVLQIFSKG